MHDSARDDLALIRRIMEDTRQEVTERGKHLVIWGGISTAGLLATWWAALGRSEVDPVLFWSVLLAGGWAASLYVGWRDGRRARVRTAGGRLLSAAWVTAAVTLTVVGTAGMFGDVLGYRALPGVLSAILAVPIWLTSLLTGERWLSWVAGGWWAGGGVMLFLPGVYALPLMAAMALLLMVVPGLVLNARASTGLGGEPVHDRA